MKQEAAAVLTPDRGGRRTADGHRVVVAVAVLEVLTPDRGARRTADGHRVVVAVAVLEEVESLTRTPMTPMEVETAAAAVMADRSGCDSTRMAVTAMTEAVAATADRGDGSSDHRRVGCGSRGGGNRRQRARH